MRPLTIGQTRGGYPLHFIGPPIDAGPHELAMRQDLQAISVHLGGVLAAQAALGKAVDTPLSLGPSVHVYLARKTRLDERQAAQRRLEHARECLDVHEKLGGDGRARKDFHRCMAYMLWSMARRLEDCGGPGGRGTADAMHVAADRHAALSTAK